MAEPRTKLIVDTLAERLREITIANGYHTDLGLSVQTERTQQGIPTTARTTVAITSKFRPDQGARGAPNERAIAGVIEIEVPTTYTDAMATVLRADDDVERALDAYLQQPQALPVTFEESVFLDRPEGLPVIAVQIVWKTRYRR